MEGDMATVTGRHYCHPFGNSLGQAQSSSGYGQGRTHVNRYTIALCVVHRTDHRRIRRIDFNHTNADPVGSSLDAGDKFVAGKTGQHAGIPRISSFQFSLLFCKVQLLHRDGLACSFGDGNYLGRSIANQCLGLIRSFAVGHQINTLDFDQVAKAVCLRYCYVVTPALMSTPMAPKVLLVLSSTAGASQLTNTRHPLASRTKR